MDPNQPGYGANDHDPYGFILNPPKHKQSLMHRVTGQQSFRRRLIIVVTGAVILLMTLALIYSLISGPGSTDSLRNLANQQNEIIRVTSLAEGKARSNSTLSLAQTTQYTTISAQKQLTDYLASRGVRLNARDLQRTADSSIDKKLDSANLVGEFDATFNKQVTDMLRAYADQLDKTYQTSQSQKERTLLQDLYRQVNILLQEPATSS